MVLCTNMPTYKPVVPKWSEKVANSANTATFPGAVNAFHNVWGGSKGPVEHKVYIPAKQAKNR